METNQLEVLARLVLPSEILDYFNIVSVEESSSEIHIHLDELMNSELSNDIQAHLINSGGRKYYA